MNFSKWIKISLTTFCISALSFSSAWGGRYALLIGIGAYLDPGAELEGPRHDIVALDRLLKTRFGFASDNIRTVTDRQATKAGILNALRNLGRVTSPGDFIFLYFSGHGTSYYDPVAAKWDIDPHTGALVPADFVFKRGRVREMLETLIIGKRDIRPIIAQLDRDRRILAVFDCCYSGFAIRPLNNYCKVKGMELEDLTADAEMDAATYENYFIRQPPYPYRNTVFISAASPLEKAVDITQEAIYLGKETIDGLPHGALTNALLHALRGRGDTNNDRKVTYQELYQYVKSEVSKEFPHTPQLSSPEGRKGILEQPVFKENVSGRPVREETDGTLRIRLRDVDQALAGRIAGIPGVRIVEKRYDILVKGDKKRYVLYLPNDTMLAEIPRKNPDKVAERLARQVRLKELIRLSFPGQTFNVFMDLIEPKGVLVEGDTIGFTIRAEAESHILLINIDPAGYISVIYPYTRAELGKVRELRRPELGRVKPPNFGTEYLKVFAFRNRPEALRKLMGREFPPDSPLFSELMRMIQQAGSSATLRVKTCAKGDLGR
ncbi:caspase family protein [Desulfobacterales bacterium HSG2]|nr:caspase family protein [Desulfobacterales bacterium HSG2]